MGAFSIKVKTKGSTPVGGLMQEDPERGFYIVECVAVEKAADHPRIDPELKIIGPKGSTSIGRSIAVGCGIWLMDKGQDADKNLKTEKKLKRILVAFGIKKPEELGEDGVIALTDKDFLGKKLGIHFEPRDPEDQDAYPVVTYLTVDEVKRGLAGDLKIAAFKKAKGGGKKKAEETDTSADEEEVDAGNLDEEEGEEAEEEEEDEEAKKKAAAEAAAAKKKAAAKGSGEKKEEKKGKGGTIDDILGL